jgi:hypothetical protein
MESYKIKYKTTPYNTEQNIRKYNKIEYKKLNRKIIESYRTYENTIKQKRRE